MCFSWGVFSMLIDSLFLCMCETFYLLEVMGVACDKCGCGLYDECRCGLFDEL